MIDFDARAEQQRAQAQADKRFRDQLRADVQGVMNMPGTRRLVFLFMQQMGVEASAFATNAMAQSHAIGKQDAAKWWIELIREHCPEKEAQIRSEGIANLNNMSDPEEEADE